VWISEAWVLKAEKGEKLDLSRLPSESPNRQEVVIIMGESREGCMQKILPILRHENGKFKGLGEANIEENQTKGRFAQFVPVEIPDKETRDMAKRVLEGTVRREERGRGQGRGMAME
jgi:hypothetical protein